MGICTMFLDWKNPRHIFITVTGTFGKATAVGRCAFHIFYCYHSQFCVSYPLGNALGRKQGGRIARFYGKDFSN